ncbi:MAG: TfoX/Sxy family protein [Planctomycetota bacterium]|jgi:TfoX/Sxy family transcriptional regulator of competence genes
MAFSEEHAQLLRDELSDLDGITEKKMFGGLCILWNGHMICGVHRSGGMARVGKELEAAALELDGVDPLSFTGRPMGGMVEMTPEAVAHPATRSAVLSMAREFVGSLAPR